MSVYKLTKLAQQLEMEQDSRSADFMLRSAMDLDRHIKTAEIEIDVLTKLARDFRPVTQAPAGNRLGMLLVLKVSSIILLQPLKLWSNCIKKFLNKP